MRRLFLGCSFFALCSTLPAQQVNIPGHLSGSFESYTQLYQKDSVINAVLPQDRVGSNNFLKLDYNFGPFTAGVQFESYLPSIAGFPFNINQSKLVNKYFRFEKNRYSIQVGDFYEQFGSGLVFRSWENRQIGINNALEGANIQVQPFNFLKLKAVYGRQRKIFDHANSNVRGLDAEFDFSLNKNPDKAVRIAPGFSYVTRYQQYTGPDPEFPATVKAMSARLGINGSEASVSLEYVHKGRDPHDVNLHDNTTGKAFLLNSTIAKNNIGFNVGFRAMENMSFRGEREAFGVLVPVNYVPALTRQHDYLTTNIYVYNAQQSGEIGGQAELFYYFPKGSDLGGKYGANLSVNFSHYNGLDDMNKIFSFGDNKFFHDLNIEWKKKWSDKWNTVLLYQNLFYNKSVVEGGLYENIKTNTVVLNTTYRYTKTRSVRFELQHLATKQDNGNWAAAVAEFTFAPTWSFTLGDLYNYDVTDIHYPFVATSYTKGGTRFGLSYGRQRAGLFCVGGVCRFVPASTGLTATLTTTFNN